MPSAYLTVGAAGFLPLREGYRINYSTSTLGLPIELSGGLTFPVTINLMTPLTIRYLSREADFVSNTTLSTIRLEPGVRYYVEKYVPKEIRVFIGGNLILSRSTFKSSIDVTQNESITGTMDVQKDYYNLGLGVELGFTYPLTNTQALDLLTNIGVLLGDPVVHGGLGNIGGVSIGMQYRVGF